MVQAARDRRTENPSGVGNPTSNAHPHEHEPVDLPGFVNRYPDAAMIVADQVPDHSDREAGWYRESNPFSSLWGWSGFLILDCRFWISLFTHHFS
jgi:hypothetical protein